MGEEEDTVDFKKLALTPPKRTCPKHDQENFSPKKVKRVEPKYILLMAVGVWERQRAYYGIEVHISADCKAFTSTAKWIRLVDESNGPLPPMKGKCIGNVYKVKFVGRSGHENQPENHMVSSEHPWELVIRTPLFDEHGEGTTNQFQIIKESMGRVVDNKGHLWDDDQCGHTINDRIRKEKLIEMRAEKGYRSVRLICVDSLIVSYFHRQYGRNIGNERRGGFDYNGKSYELKITAPDEDVLPKIRAKELLDNDEGFPLETMKMQKEIGPCYIVVAVLADREHGIKPNDAPEQKFFYKVIANIFTEGSDGEVNVHDDAEDSFLTCGDLLDRSRHVPDAIDAWEKDFLETNCVKHTNNFCSMSEAQQLKFLVINDKIKKNY